MVGLDTASIDEGRSTDFASHRILLGANIPVLENLASLDRLAAAVADLERKGVQPQDVKIEIVALPMKIRDGSGGPARVIATVSATTASGC